MKYIKWFGMAWLSLAVTVSTLALAPLLAVLVHQRTGMLDNNTKRGTGWYLFDWLDWFQTPDNSIDGDLGWRTEHWQWRYQLPTWLATYIGRVGWLWRNPGYGYGSVTMTNNGATVTGDTHIGIDPLVEGSLMIDAGDYFQFRYVKRATADKAIYLNLGWNIKGLFEAEKGSTQVCTFGLSTRLVSIK